MLNEKNNRFFSNRKIIKPLFIINIIKIISLNEFKVWIHYNNELILQSLKGLRLEYTETDLLVLRNVGKVTTQQTIAQDIGYSVGKVNFVLKALVKKGLVKAEKFAQAENKNKYRYLLTEKGIKEKIALTERFIEKKKKEYEDLQADLKKYKTSGEYALVKGSN